MRGDLLDLVLLGVTLLFAVSGFRQGFVVGVLSFVGFFGGGFLGTQLAPPLVQRFATGTARPILGIAVVFLLASLGQLLAVVVGHQLRAQLRSRSSQTLDSIGGATISALAVLLVAWMVATPLASSRFPALAKQVRNSAVIAAVDRAVPDPVRSAYGAFRRLLTQGAFPEVFGPLAPTRVASVPPPNPAVVGSAGVQQAARSVVKIVGTAPSCSRRLEGSGFVYAGERVMTNAHVVAGVRSVAVQAGAQNLPARVVLYDPERDVAVLWVPGLALSALPFGGQVPAGTSGVVAGYPLDGPFSAVPARVRTVQDVRGPDIYQNQTVTRQVYSLRAEVRSGNSGGPLLAADGRVLGVVFAAAADDPQTGFALTAAEVAGDARAGAASTARVSTQSCD